MVTLKKEDKWLRDTYIDLLIEYAKKDERIVILDADLMKAVGAGRFAEIFPKRTINAGIAEANMVSMAAGLAVMGKIPFTHTFTPFATRRVCDQVTVSVAYAGQNVKLMGSDPGVTAELNGGTHMSFEDVAIMRSIPNMVIYEPVDSAQLKAIFPQILEYNGPVYIRLLRRPPVEIFKDTDSFTLGKGSLIKSGTDVSIFATGILVAEAVMAADLLAEEGINAEVINIHTIKPLDTEMVIESAKKTGAVVVAENANIIGGLGSAIMECLGENHPVPVQRVGVKDHFGEAAGTDYLKEKYGLTHKEIVSAAHKTMKR